MRFIQFRLVGPAIVGVALLIAATATIPYFAVARIDAEARQTQEELVSKNVGLWIEDIEFSLTAWTVWDESILNLDNRFDFEWTDRNIGASLIGTSRTRFAAVLDSDDAMIYSKTDESVEHSPFFLRGPAAVIGDASGLVKEVRRREAEAKRPGIPDQIASSRIEVMGSEAVLLTAALFQPDFGTAKVKAAHAPVLITAMPIAGSLPSFFGSRFLLDDPRINPLSEVMPDRARAEVAVGTDGRPIVLSWLSPRPAADMMRHSMPLILTVALVLAAFAIFALRVSRTAAQALVGREKEMRHAATHDFLTGLANRSLIETEFARLAAQGSFSVVCLDLDGFKSVNDTHGHAAGDALLRAVAERLKLATREADRLFRLGGDEFAIFMPDTPAQNAIQICHGIARLLRQPFDLPSCQVRIGASFGVEHVGDRSVSSDVALKAADMALYRAKSGRRGGVAGPGYDLPVEALHHEAMPDEVRHTRRIAKAAS